MLFPAPEFIFLFLPVSLAINYLLPRAWRNLALIGLSLLFYAWSEPTYWWLVVAYVGWNYGIGLAIGATTKKKMVLGVGIGLNLAALVMVKYSGFLTSNLKAVGKSLGWNFPIVQWSLLVGISFYTFHCLSYLIDVYRCEKPPERSPARLALYILFFPQLVAGPIVRFKEIADQIKVRDCSYARFRDGCYLFVGGLARKLLVADTAAQVVDLVFSGRKLAEMGGPLHLLGILAYAVQIYFDFCGYSEMATGLAKMFGFDFPRNFNRPYSSTSVTEFWRRWHITLSSWFKDYLYIPLGGNRGTRVRTYLNLVVVFFLCGLWHGASWNFVAWGLWHGALLVAEKIGFGRVLERMPRWIGQTYTLGVVLIGWVFFRSDTLTDGVRYLADIGRWDWSGMITAWSAINNEQTFVLLGSLLVVVLPDSIVGQVRGRLQSVRGILFAVLFVLCLVYSASSTHSSFIYFRF